jgi:hypothetical protein
MHCAGGEFRRRPVTRWSAIDLPAGAQGTDKAFRERDQLTRVLRSSFAKLAVSPERHIRWRFPSRLDCSIQSRSEQPRRRA